MGTIIENIRNRYPEASKDNLIPILQDIQEDLGHLSEESIVDVGDYLHIPTSKIYGVATFYNQFRFKPNGQFHVQVCRGTACHVLGSSTVLDELENQLKVKAGDTTRDSLFSLEVVACIGACGLAPVIAINGNFHAKVSQNDIKQILSDYKEKAK